MSETVTVSSRELMSLALLDAADGRIEGKTRLQKLAFLLIEEEIDEWDDAYEFIKYDYGPFSKSLLEDIEHLERRGMVTIDTERTVGGNTRYDYRLEPLGETVADDAFTQHEWTDLRDAAEAVVTEYGDYPLRNLIQYIYEKYPEYEKNSVYRY